MNNLEQLKEDIRKINPEMTDELLDLLYVYFSKKFAETLKNYFSNS